MFDVGSDTEQDLDIICHLHDEIIEASGEAKGIHTVNIFLGQR
jgi:hypothetical protein